MPYALQARVLSQFFFFPFLSSVSEGHECAEDLSAGLCLHLKRRQVWRKESPFFMLSFCWCYLGAIM